DVVLTTSSPSRWIGGNVADLTMRSIHEGLTPLDMVRGYRLSKGTASHGLQGEQSVAATTGGGLYHAGEALNRNFAPRLNGEHAARTVLAAPWRAWKTGIFTLEHFIEDLPQWGA